MKSGATASADTEAHTMESLVSVVQALSHARDLDGIMQIVRKAARALTGADGATFVLRDDDKCFYAEEDAISPLWKGQRFPLKTCISGWAMLNKEAAVIEDIYQDPRIPHDAYRPTFVKSLVMVPIRREDPIGAIGNYWAKQHMPTETEVTTLQALADVTSVAIENTELNRRLTEKVAALEESNQELTRFAWIASHDLKSPLRAISNLSQWVEEEAEGVLPETSKEKLNTLRARVRRMEKLLDDILEYARTDDIKPPDPGSGINGGEFMKAVRELTNLPEGMTLEVDPAFDAVCIPVIPLQRIFVNLIDNAAKHHDKEQGVIKVGVKEEGSRYVITVSDDGPGIAPEYHKQVFEMFQTLKPRDKVEGSGMGLALVRKLLNTYDSDIELYSVPGEGATFRFYWPRPVADDEKSQ